MLFTFGFIALFTIGGLPTRLVHFKDHYMLESFTSAKNKTTTNAHNYANKKSNKQETTALKILAIFFFSLFFLLGSKNREKNIN